MTEDQTDRTNPVADALRHYLDERDLTFVTDDHGEVFGVPFGRVPGEPADLTVAFDTSADDRPPALRAEARGSQRFERDRWAVVLWGVNAWNARSGAPRARLEVAQPDDEDAEVVLDDWLPVGRSADPDAVAAFCDAFLAGAATFWAAPTDEPAGDTTP